MGVICFATSLCACNSHRTYKLVGEIATQKARAVFPEALVEKFRKGFPDDWEQLIRDNLDKVQQAAGKTVADASFPKSKPPKSKPPKPKPPKPSQSQPQTGTESTHAEKSSAALTQTSANDDKLRKRIVCSPSSDSDSPEPNGPKRRKRAPETVTPKENESAWSCVRCTYLNAASRSRCEMCKQVSCFFCFCLTQIVVVQDKTDKQSKADEKEETDERKHKRKRSRKPFGSCTSLVVFFLTHVASGCQKKEESSETA